jgi:hypothetical protein
MVTVKSQFVQRTSAAIMLVLIISALAMVWPGIIVLMIGVLRLIQSFGVGQEIVVLSWTEVSHVPVVVASLRRSELPAMLS